MTRVSNKADSLAPPPSPYPQQIDPSPTDSNGTESTDIDEEVQDEFENTDLQPRTSSVCSRPQSRDNVCHPSLGSSRHKLRLLTVFE